MAVTPKTAKIGPRIIEVGDIKPGQRIVGRVRLHADGSDDIAASKPLLVKTVDECPGAWRTHVHVNRLGCWDGRTRVVVS